MKKIYITTPIFYVNDLPHIGHAYTSIICDTISRFYRLKKYDVLFTTGTDEHGLKVEKAANLKNKDPKDFVDEVSKNFRELTQTLKLSNTDFIRTTEARHKAAATEFWSLLNKNGQIYMDKYSGWYSIKDESFYHEKELKKIGEKKFETIDGELVEWIEEESYFFKLSDWQEKLLNFYDQHPDFVTPSSRYNEVKSFVRSGLRDLSISRNSFNWGIKVKESNHIMYVWIDALVNYLTSLGYPDMGNKLTYWENSYHIIGKDILKFHAVYWPALLMAAGFKTPKKIVAHGWWTNNGKKISKSLGNTIDPNEMVENFGLDQFKYFLLREVPLGNDGDFSETSFLNRINSDLSNNLGNLIQRVMKFLSKNFEQKLPLTPLKNDDGFDLIEKGYSILESLENKFERFHISKCLEEIFFYIDDMNRFMDKSEPWKTFKKNPEEAAKTLSVLVESFRIIGIYLQPFIPDFSIKLLDLLNINLEKRDFDCLNYKNVLKKGHVFNKPLALFPRYEK